MNAELLAELAQMGIVPNYTQNPNQVKVPNGSIGFNSAQMVEKIQDIRKEVHRLGIGNMTVSEFLKFTELILADGSLNIDGLTPKVDVYRNGDTMVRQVPVEKLPIMNKIASDSSIYNRTDGQLDIDTLFLPHARGAKNSNWHKGLQLQGIPEGVPVNKLNDLASKIAHKTGLDAMKIHGKYDPEFDKLIIDELNLTDKMWEELMQADNQGMLALSAYNKKNK